MKAKKLTSIFLIVAIVLTLGISAMATIVTEGSITVKNVGDATTLEVYKILEYTYDDDASVTGYSGVNFANDEYKAVFVNAINAHVGGTTPVVSTSDSVSTIMLYITNNLATDSTFAAALAAALEKCIEDNSIPEIASKSAGAGTSTDGKFVFDLDVGYYLILDTTGVDNDGYSALAMLTPLGPDVDVVLKSSSITVPDKSVTGINEIDITDNDGNSVNIGDVVSFSITVEIPNFSTYKTDSYSFKVYDIMDKGYTFSNDAIFSIGSASVQILDDSSDPAKAAVVAAMASDNVSVPVDAQLIEFDFGDISVNFADYIGQTLTISYTATVNNNVLDGVVENGAVTLQNGVYVVGNSVEIETYGFEFDKVDEYTNSLDGVIFQLYKADDVSIPGSWTYDPDEPLTFTYDTTNSVYFYNADSTDADITTYLNVTTKAFGLEAGNYVLVETQPLDGYNPLASPYEIELPTTGAIAGTYVIGEIENNSGIELPSTGGIGTIMFGIFGCLIIVGGATGITMLIIKLKRRHVTSR